MDSFSQGMEKAGYTHHWLDTVIATRLCQAEVERLEGIKKYGWAPDCKCELCGDTGKFQDTNDPCPCDSGESYRVTRERQEVWSKFAPRVHLHSRLETHPRAEARKVGQQWREHEYPSSRGLVITGPTGSGKTGLALSLGYELHMQGTPVRFGTFTEILDEMRQASAPKQSGVIGPSLDSVTNKYVNPGVLILDDLGTQKVTEFVVERLFAIVDGRYQRSRPTIITTNLGPAEIKQRFGERVLSRILESSLIVALAGNDLRMDNVVQFRRTTDPLGMKHVEALHDAQ